MQIMSLFFPRVYSLRMSFSYLWMVNFQNFLSCKSVFFLLIVNSEIVYLCSQKKEITKTISTRKEFWYCYCCFYFENFLGSFKESLKGSDALDYLSVNFLLEKKAKQRELKEKPRRIGICMHLTPASLQNCPLYFSMISITVQSSNKTSFCCLAIYNKLNLRLLGKPIS